MSSCRHPAPIGDALHPPAVLALIQEEPRLLPLEHLRLEDVALATTVKTILRGIDRVEASIEAIRTAYKTRFGQDSVSLIR